MEHAAQTWSWACSIDMNEDKQHVFVHAACPCLSPYCMTMSVLHGLEQAALILYGYAAWTWTYSMDIQHAHGHENAA
jgi:hypothetical protein